MTVWEYVIGAIIILAALLVIAVIMLQEGQQSNMGAISGNSESYMDKGNSRTQSARLSRWTKILAGVFFGLVFVGMLATKFLGA